MAYSRSVVFHPDIRGMFNDDICQTIVNKMFEVIPNSTSTAYMTVDVFGQDHEWVYKSVYKNIGEWVFYTNKGHIVVYGHFAGEILTDAD